MKKLVIIPAYNEGENIVYTVNEILKKAPDYDYIVINDCSKDDTHEILRQHNFNHLNLPVNLGIGGAVQTGYRYAFENDYDIAVQVDGDGQHDPSYLANLENELLSGQYDMVIGSRFIENKGFQSTFMRRVGIVYFYHLIRFLTKKKITDPTSGFRMCNRKVISVFADDYPRDYPEPESVVALLLRGFKVAETAVRMKERQGGVSSINARKSVYYMIKVTLAILIEKARTQR